MIESAVKENEWQNRVIHEGQSVHSTNAFSSTFRQSVLVCFQSTKEEKRIKIQFTPDFHLCPLILFSPSTFLPADVTSLSLLLFFHSSISHYLFFLFLARKFSLLLFTCKYTVLFSLILLFWSWSERGLCTRKDQQNQRLITFVTQTFQVILWLEDQDAVFSS